MKERGAYIFFLAVFIYGCMVPFQAALCRTGSITEYSFYDEYIDDYIFFDTCQYTYPKQKLKVITKDTPITYSNVLDERIPSVNDEGTMFTFVLFCFLWLIRWIVSGKHFWQSP